EPLLVAGRTAAPLLRGATISMLPGLARSESEPLAAMREALGEMSPDVVAPALKSLSIIGVEADLASVARLVHSSDPKIASAAKGAVLAMAARHPEGAGAMLRDVGPRGEDALWAAVVIEALARAGATPPADSTFLASALSHRSAVVRRAAIDALAAAA